MRSDSTSPDGITTTGWQNRGTTHLFESRWFSLRQDQLTLPNGADITYTWVEHPGYVLVVPLLPDGQVVMERIYRHTLQRTLLECPSGGLDGQAPAIAARRELEEETGYRAGKLERLGTFAGSSGISNEEYHLFLATALSADGLVQREQTEEITVELIPSDSYTKWSSAAKFRMVLPPWRSCLPAESLRLRPDRSFPRPPAGTAIRRRNHSK